MNPRFQENHVNRNRPIDEEIWLLGQPLLRNYLDFVRDHVVGGATESRAALADEWRRANDHYHELEQSEHGIADRAECHDLDSSLDPLVEEIKSDTRFRRTFTTLPTCFAMVELDKLIVYQKSVTHTFVKSIAARLGPSPTPEALFRFALPLGQTDTPVKIQRVGSRRFVFECESTDFRFQEPVLFKPRQIHDYDPCGPIAGVVGLVVGFGSNFLNVIRVGDRLVLHNGYHRACALRELGITHAPAIVQTATRPDELDISAKSDVARDPEFFFKTARPPLLKDFFDPNIRKMLRVRRPVRMIEVNFEVRSFTLNDG